ncbi:MAG TPA: isochorismatase family cysteine hydrolase [Steroidobacteraceae bacterium]|nr:isochorismatase family cysteine hydrolase [Steroidobacteraceae bacterium]
MAAVGRYHRSLHGSAPDRSPFALLILDMIADFGFEGGAAIARAALPVARRIARLAERARRARVPVIFVNDNLGRWRSDLPSIVRHCSRAGSRGAAILECLEPQRQDYGILKPKHSGFFATPLATLLEYLGARTLVLTGASTHQCVLFTANDAYVRDYRLWIPADCVASKTRAQTRLASRYFRSVLGANMRPSIRIRFARK